jgi:hypothetical protein
MKGMKDSLHPEVVMAALTRKHQRGPWSSRDHRAIAPDGFGGRSVARATGPAGAGMSIDPAHLGLRSSEPAEYLLIFLIP